MAVISAAAPKTLDANAMAKITVNAAEERRSFVRRGQFCGFSGSLGPVQVTISKHDSGSFCGVFVPLGVSMLSGVAMGSMMALTGLAPIGPFGIDCIVVGVRKRYFDSEKNPGLCKEVFFGL